MFAITDATPRSIVSSPSTVLNSANETSLVSSSENKKGWKQQITNLFNKVLYSIQQQWIELTVDDRVNNTKIDVMFGVEYMSQGTLKGSSQGNCLKIAQQQLEKLCRDFPKNIEFKKALDEITFACSIEETRSQVFERIASKHCAEKIVDKMTLLEEGEGILLPAYYLIKTGGGHSMMARIICTDTTPPKKYTFRIYNEGSGIEFHTSISNLDNSTLSWENVSLDQLTQNFFTSFLQQGIPNNAHSIQGFYALLNNGLGKASNTTADSKNLTSCQRGGSCAAQSILAALRDILSKEEYQTLKSQMRHDSLYRIYTQITLRDPDPLLPLIALELIHKIEKNKDKAGSFSNCQHLSNIKQEMETRILQQSHLTPKERTNHQQQIAAFFKGNSVIVDDMTESTVRTVIEKITTTPCTKKQFNAIQKKAKEYKIPLDAIQHRFTRSKGTVQFQNILSDKDAITELNFNKMGDLVRRISSQEITCKYSEFYNIKARAEELGIQIPEELDKHFPKLDAEGMISQWQTDEELVNYMDLKTVTMAQTLYPSSKPLLERYKQLTKSNNK